LDVGSTTAIQGTVSNTKSEIGICAQTGSVICTGTGILRKLTPHLIRAGRLLLRLTQNLPELEHCAESTYHASGWILGNNTIDKDQAQRTEHHRKKGSHFGRWPLSRSEKRRMLWILGVVVEIKPIGEKDRPKSLDVSLSFSLAHITSQS
jgi:hypothetical protein